MAVELPAFLKKKIGPFPVGVWVLIGGGGIGLALYVKKRRGAAAGTQADMGELAADTGLDMYGVPVDTSGGMMGGLSDVPYSFPPYMGGGIGGGYTTFPEPPPLTTDGLPPGEGPPPVDGYLGPPLPGDGGTGLVQPNAQGRCPPGYYNAGGGRCMPKANVGGGRQQPGATPAGSPRKCQQGYHWNGFTCIPNVGGRKRRGKRKQGARLGGPR